MPARHELCDTLRFLAIDAVEAANSGHPGMPMGMAEIAEALWRGHLKHNPADPAWPDRDRFVLSNGHGSMLLYALLHLTGYALPLEELRRFRQLGSRTPGHPEVGVTPGVETTTGPLGQGLANAVGMALAEALLAAEFNRPGHTIVDHHTWVFVGDGCLMEGISHEACSLAGTLGLAKLVAIYDDNGISIDGRVEHWFADDTPRRFEAYGWRVIRDVDGHDSRAVEAALAAARQACGRPTLVCCKTIIGRGSPGKAGTHDVHGAALGAAEVAATRARLGWTAAPFEIPAEIRAAWNARAAGAQRQREWERRLAAYAAVYPELAAEFERRVIRRALPVHWEEACRRLLAATVARGVALATRKASQNAIEALLPLLPELLGGSADLTGSNLTAAKTSVAVRRGIRGNHINYGVREFGMSALMNGIALHGGHIPYGGTFLAFSDYSRNAIRMSALMGQRVIYVFTHDSIGLGEDGPTHQPVEHASSLRLIPNNSVWRPCDAVETLIAWQAAIERCDGPSCLLLSRQSLPHFMRNELQLSGIRRGGYVLAENPAAAITLLATGSEVALAMRARELLAMEGILARVVSMPNCREF
ncbi:MAG TPA: transketolase, partial [Steroidobacteraceae bacterium]|nr:transketolase [Steroidobacteraceae bacterium]